MLFRKTTRSSIVFPMGAMILALAAGSSAVHAGDPPPSVPKMGATPGKPQPIATVQLKPGEIPQIKFDEPIFEFGRVPSGKDVLHEYWFTNTGNGPLEILMVKPSCGCTTTGDFDRVVQPGRKGRIPIKVATSHASGRIMKTVTVQTNVAPPGDSTILSIRGDLWKAVQATPDSLFFGRLTEGDDTNNKIVKSTEITTAGGAVLTLANLKSSNPIFRPELIEVERGAKYNLTVTATPPFRLGSLYSTVELSTGVAEVPTLQVSCNLVVVPEMEITPDRLSVPSVSSAAKRTIQIRNNGKMPMQLSRAVCSNPIVLVQLQELKPGREWTVAVDIPASFRATAPEGDTISIDTDQADRGRITVPLVENKLYRPPTSAPASPSTAARTVGASREPAAKPKSGDASRVP